MLLQRIRFSQREEGRAVRRSPMMAFALLSVIGLAVFQSVCVIYTPIRLEYIEGMGVSAVFAVCALMVWVVVWASTFVITDEALEIRSFIFVEVVPWGRVVKIDMISGVTVHLDDKTQRDSLQFGDSLLGSFTGQPTYKPAVAKLEAARMHYQSLPQRAEGSNEITSRIELPLLELAVLLAIYIPLAVAGMYFLR